MRLLAFILLTWAAFDWPMPLVDRAGLAAAGVACLALALPARSEWGDLARFRRRRDAAPEPAEDMPPELTNVLERISAYTQPSPTRS